MTKLTTGELRPGMVVMDDRYPLSSPVVVHDTRDATVSFPGHEWAVWLLGGWLTDSVGQFPPFVVNVGDRDTWTVVHGA